MEGHDRGAVRTRRRLLAIAWCTLLALTTQPGAVRGDYVESFQPWSATTAGVWETVDLSGAPYNVPADAVVEVAIFNTRTSFELEGGVRAVGSSLQRSFVLHEAQSGGADAVVIHVQADASSRIEHYSEDTSYITFALVGYWTSGTYVELADSFTAGADGSWRSYKLGAYGVSNGAVAEIVMVNANDAAARVAGVREAGSALQRLIDLHEAEGGGVDAASMFVQAQSNANAGVEVYAESDADVSFHLVGYWTDPPGTYSELFTSAGTPSASSTWQAKDLTSFGVPVNTVAELLLANGDPSNENNMGVRRNGSAIGDRMLDLQEAESEGRDAGRMHVKTDGDAVIEFYHEDVTDTPFAFYLTGYWITPSVNIYETGGSTDVLEEGTTDYYTVVLSTRPTDDVVVTADPDAQTDLGAGAGVAIQLTFTTSDWDTSQSVTVTAVDDATIEGDHTSTIAHSASSSDSNYDGIPVVDVVANIIDNDTPGVRISESNGSTVVTERGATDDYTIVLDAPPSDTVTVTAQPDTQTDLGSGGGVPVIFTFTTGNWSTPQTVTVTAVDDGVSEGTHSSTITHAAASNDTDYDGISVAGLTATVLEFAGSWKMDDGSGASVTDCSTGGNDGALSPSAGTGPQWTSAGKLCSALSFDGTDDYVSVRADASLDMAGDATIAGWFKLDADFDGTTGASQILFAKYNDNTENLHVALVGTDYAKAAITDGSLVFKIEEGGDYRYTWTNRTSWSADTWYHFAATLDASDNAGNQIYIDGVDDTAGSVASGTNANMSYSAAIGIGGRNADTDDLSVTRYLDGVMDEVRLFAGILSAAAIEDLASEAPYTVTDPGTPSGTIAVGESINDSSLVIGSSEGDGVPHAAWVWEGGAFTALGTLGGTEAEAYDLNDSGTIVGRAEDASGYTRAFLWDNIEGMSDLGTLAGDADSEAMAINTSDEVVGTSLTAGLPATDRRAFLYLPTAAYGLSTGMNNLGTLGGNESVATDINDSGQIVGGAQVNTFDYMHPFLWLPSAAYGLSAGMNDLGTLGGDDGIIIHRAEALNESGEVVGLSFTASGDSHAFLWLPADAYGLSAGMNDLGTLSGGTASWAFDINDSGEVVGTSGVSGGAYHAFHAEDGVMTDLHDLIDPRSAWVLNRATGINGSSQITGFGINPTGNYRPFVATPVSCGCGGGAAAVSMTVQATYGTTDDEGRYDGSVIDDTGAVVATVSVADAVPGTLFTATFRSSDDHIARTTPVTGTLVMGTTTPDGNFAATVSMIVNLRDVAALDTDATDLELMRSASADEPAVTEWVPAGAGVGETEPTGVIGESGLVYVTPDAVQYWAVVDTAGSFTIGLAAAAPDAELGGQDQVESQPVPTAAPRMCGVAALPSGLIGLTLLVGRRRRRYGRTD